MSRLLFLVAELIAAVISMHVLASNLLHRALSLSLSLSLSLGVCLSPHLVVIPVAYMIPQPTAHGCVHAPLPRERMELVPRSPLHRRQIIR